LPSPWSQRRMRRRAANVVAGRAARREVRPWRRCCSAMPRRQRQTRAKMARPNKGAAHVDDLKGSQRAKRRVQMILATISGEMSVADACREIGVGPTQFANLREQILQGAVDAAEPKPIGRPKLAAEPVNVDDLEDEILERDFENTMLRAKLDVNEALRARGASKSPAGGKAPKKRPRGRG